MSTQRSVDVYRINNLKCPSTGERINRLTFDHKMKYCSNKKDQSNTHNIYESQKHYAKCKTPNTHFEYIL